MAKTKKLTMVKLNRDAIGDSGLNEAAHNSNNSTEYLLELQGRQGSINYQKMSKSDAQIGMILNIYKNPIKSANWGISVPDDSTEQEIKAIEILKKWFFSSSETYFSTLLGQILSCVEYGFSAFERVWKLMEYEGAFYYVPDLQQRLQTSIENIYPSRGIIQQSTLKSGIKDIPIDDMVFFTLNQQGSDMRGQSVLRHAYANWKRRNYYQELLGIGMQRSATGVPWMEVPEGTDVDSKDYIATELLLKNITAHENAYMITKAGFKFDIKSFPIDTEKIQKVIDSFDEKNAISALVQFILLGTGGGGGAYALSRDQSDMFLDGLNYIVTFIQQVFHRKVIVPFLEINFGDSVDHEKVMLRGLNLNKKAGAELAATLAQLSASGFVKATIDDEVQLRKFLELPELSDEEIEARKTRASIPQPDPEPEPEPSPTNSQAVKLSERKIRDRIAVIELEKKQLQDVMEANLLMIKDKLVADIRKTLNQGTIEIRGLKKIEVSWSKYSKVLEKKLAGIANLGWNQAKTKTKKAINLSEPILPTGLSDKELAQYILNQAEIVAEDQVTAMKMNAILTASNGPVKGYSTNQTMANVGKVIEKFIKSNKISAGANLMAVGALNFGETQFYKEISDQLWGYEFVAVDDGATTDICRWYNGKTFSIDSAELSTATPPLHPNCRSHLEPIYKSEVKDRPNIDDKIAPPSIQDGKSVY